MSAEKLILLFAAIFLFQQNAFCFNPNRIVNGSATPDGVFEFLPRLFMLNLEHVGGKIQMGTCSSTIISPRHILTAAHCIFVGFANPPPTMGKKMYRVQAVLVHYRPKDKVVQDEDGKKYFLDLQNHSIAPRIFVHPSYIETKTFVNDIAIIEFPVGTNLNIPPITLASDYVEKEGDMAIAAGYGIYKNAPDPTDPKKEITEVPIVLQNTTVPVHIDEQEIVAKKTAILTSSYETYAYRGDSGGPLMIERNGKIYQIGIASAAMVNHTAKLAFSEAKCEPLPPSNGNPPVNPDKPAQPNEPSTKISSNVNGTATTLLPQPFKQTESSSMGFNLNILLFVFIGIVFFA